MAVKIGIVNQKGGVGKTTTAICLTDAFTRKGYKTLLIDFDPQGNASYIFKANDCENTIYDSIIGGKNLRDIIVTGNDMGDIAPADERLIQANKELINARLGENKLKKAIAEIENDYEVIFVDAGPTPGIMMDNVLTAVDGVIIPMQAETLATVGLTSLIKNINEIKEELNPDLEVYGILLTMYDKSVSMHNELKKEFDKIDESVIHKFHTVIRRSKAIPKTQGFMNIDPENLIEKKVVDSQGSIYKYDSNNGAIDYSNLAQELMEVLHNG
ncbi:MAG: AAA family ATPase [Eubacterium sp.]|nr:AAA family ATPase [Eubacterium sp.]